MAIGGSIINGRRQSGEQAYQSPTTPRENDFHHERNNVSLPEPTDTPNFHQPPEWERRCRDLWKEGTEVAKKPDGSVNDWDVINWLLTRKGGANASWPELEEGEQAIEDMRKDKFNMHRVIAEIAEEQEEKERMEERKRLNKWRARPRSEWLKEKKQRQAEAAKAVSAENGQSRAGGHDDA